MGDKEVALISLDQLPASRVKVSSVLNKDVKQFGKKFMFDGDEETCWNSDQGSHQQVTVELPFDAHVSRIEIKFQGGFAAHEGVLLAGADIGSLKEIQKFYPNDDNTLQSFSVAPSGSSKYYRVIFQNSTDFYGRTIIYHLQLYGTINS